MSLGFKRLRDKRHQTLTESTVCLPCTNSDPHHHRWCSNSMPADCRSVCSVSECQLRSSARYRVVVAADMAGASLSAIGGTFHSFPLGVPLVPTSNSLLRYHIATLLLFTYSAVQYRTSLLSPHLIDGTRLTDSRISNLRWGISTVITLITVTSQNGDDSNQQHVTCSLHVQLCCSVQHADIRTRIGLHIGVEINMATLTWIQHAMHKGHIAIGCLPRSTKCSHFISQTARFSRKNYCTQNVFWFSVQLLFETFLVLRRTERDMIKNVHWSVCMYCTVPLVLSDFNTPSAVSTNFQTLNKY